MATLGAPLPGNSMSSNNGTSRLAMMQARLREQLMVEKESRLLQMAARQEAERNNTIQRVTKTSASSLSSTLSSLNSSGAGQGRVRKMFEERRTNGYNHSPVGWDKSYPLEPVRGPGGGGGKPPKPKGLVRNNRGVSMDRAYPSFDSSAMKRSQSHATLQKNNNNYNDPRSPGRLGLRPPQQRVPAHHKSTSSLLDANQNYNGRASSGSSAGGYSRGPSRDPSPAPSPSHMNGNRFGFRNNNNSRGPSPSPQPNGSPARSGPPPPGLRRTNDEVDAGRTPAQKRSMQPRPPVRQPPQRPPRQAPRQPPPTEPENNDDADSPKPESKTPVIRTRGHPITQVKSRNNNNNNNNNDDEYDAPKPVPRSKAALNFKPTGPAKSSVPAGLVSCKVCGRNFAPDRLEKHEAICAKSKAKSKKRKVFDPVKMRTKGTEAEKFVAKGKHLEKTPAKPKKADWRKKHEDFIATVRAAKGVAGYEAPPLDTSDYVECPHCGRKFSEGVADRHIPKCASIQSNKPAGPAGRRR